MLNKDTLLLAGFVTVTLLAVALVWGPRFMSVESRDRRRRRRNYRKVVSRRRGPTVRLAANLSRS